VAEDHGRAAGNDQNRQIHQDRFDQIHN
jgi:hypothetical protein